MAIETYVKALQSGSYDAEKLTHFELFLESYNGRTLFEYIADDVNYIDNFNKTLTRFAQLVTECEHNSALYPAIFKEGLTILVNKLVHSNDESTLLNMINNPSQYFSFLNAQAHKALMPLLGHFISEVELPKMIRHASMINEISKITKTYSSLAEIRQAGLGNRIKEIAYKPLYATHRNDSTHYSAALLRVLTIQLLTSAWVSPSIAAYIPSLETNSCQRLLAFASAIGNMDIPRLYEIDESQKKEHLFLLQLIYRSGNETLRKEIVNLLDNIISTHASDPDTLNIITQTILPAPIGAWEIIAHDKTPLLLSGLSETSVNTLMSALQYQSTNPDTITYYSKQVTAVGKITYFTLFCERKENSEQWKVDSQLAMFIAFAVMPKVKHLFIKITCSGDYADKALMALISSAKVTFVPEDEQINAVHHAEGIAYLHNYGTNSTGYKFDISKMPYPIVYNLSSQLLDFGIRYLCFESAIRQASSILFTQAQELLAKKEMNTATIHYFLCMHNEIEVYFDLLVKSTGCMPGPLTLAGHDHKIACANYLIQALPSLLIHPESTYHFNCSTTHPIYMTITTDNVDQRISNLQQSLSSKGSPMFLWILFGDPNKQIRRYCYDIHLYANHVEPGFFTRNGCGNLKLLTKHIPKVQDMHVSTSSVALTSSGASKASSSSTAHVLHSSKKTVDNKFS